MIYNFPGAASGIDLDSDFLIELSELPNCFGAKVSHPQVEKEHEQSVITLDSSTAHLRRYRKGNSPRCPHPVGGLPRPPRSLSGPPWILGLPPSRSRLQAHRIDHWNR